MCEIVMPTLVEFKIQQSRGIVERIEIFQISVYEEVIVVHYYHITVFKMYI